MKIEIKKQSKKKNEFFIDDILKKEIQIFGSSFNNKHKEKFYGELSVLLTSGIDISKALVLSSESFSNKRQKELIHGLNHKVVGGSSMSHAMESLKIFSPYEIKSIEIGEQTGELGKVSADLAEYYLKKNDQKREIISAITYPAIVMVTAVLVVFFMLKYVVPMFSDIFEQNRVELPFLTQIVVSISIYIQEYGVELFLGYILIIISWKFLFKRPWFKAEFEGVILKIPLVGIYIQKIHLSKFSHTMMLLANSRIPIASSLLITRDVIGFSPLKNAIIKISDDITRGEKLSEAFKKQKIFDNKIISLLIVAEETNKTEYVFQKLYAQYSRDLELQARNFSNLINPLLTIIVGLLVGIILIAMYLPMFRLSSVII